MSSRSHQFFIVVQGMRRPEVVAVLAARYAIVVCELTVHLWRLDIKVVAM